MSAYFDRAYVERVIREEALAANIRFEDVAHMCRRADAIEARRKAVARIVAEKACAPTTLAAVWGCDPQHLMSLLDREPRKVPALVGRGSTFAAPPNNPYADTERRLSWAHGEARAASIIAGQDEATNIDIAAWRGLGSRP